MSFAIVATVVLLGPDEVAQGTVTVKCMSTGEQATHAASEVAGVVRNLAQR